MRAHRVGIERDCLKMEKPLIVEIKGFLSFRCRNQRHPPDSVSFKNTVAITSNIGQTIIPVCKNYAISRRKKNPNLVRIRGFYTGTACSDHSEQANYTSLPTVVYVDLRV